MGGERWCEVKKFKVGQLVWVANLFMKKDVFVKYVRMRRLDQVIENYLDKCGLRYHCTRPEYPMLDNGGNAYGMAYPPETVFHTEAEAKAYVRSRIDSEIEKLQKLKEAV